MDGLGKAILFDSRTAIRQFGLFLVFLPTVGHGYCARLVSGKSCVDHPPGIIYAGP